MPDHVRRVGVFVDPDEELLEHAISSGNLHAPQLHGKETPERVAAIRARHGRETWNAVAGKPRTDRSEERRVGEESVRTGRSRWPPAQSKKNTRRKNDKKS